MGFLARAVKGSSVWDRFIELTDGGLNNKAGPSVNNETAFRVSAALACLRTISWGVAQTPMKLFRERQNAGLRMIEPDRKHPQYDLITAQPNSWQSAFEFFETITLHAAMGNAYVYKGMYENAIGELIPLRPDSVRAKQKVNFSVVYEVRGENGEFREVPADLIWHIRGPSWDGFLGMETLNLAREALGLSVALEESHAALHANGVRTTGVYSVEGKLSEEQQTQLTAWIKKTSAGAAKAGTPMVLDRAAKFTQTSMTGMDAQHLETRKHQIEEVCRFFGVLPIMIGFTGDKASTYASAEAMFQAHMVHTLTPWHTRIEQSADVNLITKADRRAGLYHKFVTNALMRAATKDRGDYFAKALGSGGSTAWMTQDEVRALDELNPMGGTAAQLPVTTNAPAGAPA